MTQIKYEVNEEPIVLSKYLMDLLLGQENPGALLSLYCFYYYTAKWQRTNLPKATTEYVAKGLNWTTNSVRKHKAVLIELNLIKDLIRKDDKGKIIGHYIKVYFIWSSNKVHQITPLSGDEEYPILPKSHRVGNREANSLSIINQSPAMNDEESDIILKRKEKDNKYQPCARYLADIVKTTKNIRLNPQTISAWATEIRKLSEINGVSVKRIHTVLEWYAEHVGGAYIPVIESGSSLRQKFTKLEDAIKREEVPIRTNIKSKFWDGIEYKWDAKKEGWFNRGGDKWSD